MIVSIEREAGHVAAMGHRVALEQGGEEELKRRCLETLSHLNYPPDHVRFDRLWEPAPAAESEPDPEPMGAASTGATFGVAAADGRPNSSAPTSPGDVPPTPSIAQPHTVHRSHKRR